MANAGQFLSGVKVMINTIWGKIPLLRTTNNNKEKIYCDANGNIFNSLNNSLQDSL